MSDGAGLIVHAAQDILKETGRGPSAYAITAQRIRRWVADGAVTLEAAREAIGVLIDTDPNSIPPDTDIAAEVAPILRRDLQADAVRVAMDEYAKRGDFSRVTDMLSSARRIGVVDTTVGTRMGAASFEVIRDMKRHTRLPTGVQELDAVLGGGIRPGTLAAWLGAYGAGKSMALTHVAAQAVRLGLFVVEATLELQTGVQLARLKANLTGVTIDEIIDGDDARCAAVLATMQDQLGPFIVKDFPAKATTALDIIEWVEECERMEKRPVDLLVVDYADKLKSHDPKDRSEYDAQGTVWEALRLFAETRHKRVWTASQAKRGATDKRTKDQGRRTEGDDVADSINKPRIVDYMISLDRTPDKEQYNYFVTKNRHGRDGLAVGPIPHDQACGRIAPVDPPNAT